MKPYIDENDIEITFIRSPGPGGQNVNKVASACQLRFNVQQAPYLDPVFKSKLLKLAGSRATSEGEIVIKAHRYRTQERNKHDALMRFYDLVSQAAFTPNTRKKTKPTFASKQKRLQEKKKHSNLKQTRKKLSRNDD